jgi:hypothetical protein
MDSDRCDINNNVHFWVLFLIKLQRIFICWIILFLKIWYTNFSCLRPPIRLNSVQNNDLQRLRYSRETEDACFEFWWLTKGNSCHIQNGGSKIIWILTYITDSQYKDLKAFPKRQKMKCMILVFFLLFWKAEYWNIKTRKASVSREYRSLCKSLFWTEFKRMGGRH